MTKPTISEVLLENIVKRLEEQSKFFKELKSLDSTVQSVNHHVCKYKPPDTTESNQSSFYKYIAGADCSLCFFCLGLFITIKSS